MTRLLRTAAICILLFAPAPPLAAQSFTPEEVRRWEQQAQDIEIIRDRWGIAHVYGETDADAVFGMVYAQAEDDFNRVEMNYILSLGYLAQAEGEGGIWHDLRARMYADPDSLKAAYSASPDWLKRLMDSWAAGLNYYLHTHPDVEPRVIRRFEPWMALSFTEGSIGGDIERISLEDLAAFYGGTDAPEPVPSPLEEMLGSLDGPAPEPRGSNGFAIAPELTRNGNALLFINPHTSFYFRSELQMTSNEGLNAYGAVTWGQFFIYQGFSERAGWMHTSSRVDNIDWFLETPVRRNGRYFYRYGDEERPMTSRTITIPYRTDRGLQERTFTAYFTHRGPIVGREGERWLSVHIMWQPVNALIQSYSRTRAANLDEYVEIMRLHTNSSNNTIFADAEGNIAYFHSNYIPRRDPRFDWSQPVDGSDPATAYDGVLSYEETPNVVNPDIGWVYNVNNWPWSAAGPDSPRREDYPAYVETTTAESPRGKHALMLLEDPDPFTMASLTELAYDSYLPSFAEMVPALLQAVDEIDAAWRIVQAAEVLRDWDYRWGVNSVATSLAVFWGEDVLRAVAADARERGMSGEDFIAHGHADDEVLLSSFAGAVARLEEDFGTWQVPWWHINRFQRISPEIGPNFDDARHSIPVPFTSARWGSLASFGARPYPNTKKWYGTSGNSFVAVVEFGDSVRARAVSAGGESGDPASPHFDDQAAIYAMGALRDVYFYRSDVEAHAERRYAPGQ
ncbi:MAG TPA: penicillin acylase family protein [Longimicrobiales bacterium]|nr:penicillin acylase family protein [Longimicrobiales bacterium]